MQRRTLDVIFSAGCLGLAVFLLVLGIVLTSNTNFSKAYVHDQLSQQNIWFSTSNELSAREKDLPCLVKYAGDPVTTGKQAECYANAFIGLHLNAVAGGKTYADLDAPQSELRAQIAATPATDPALPALQQQLADVTAQRETLYKGETLRGLLLTSFGFSVFGVKGGQVGTVAYGAAALLALLSLAGFVYAAKTARSESFAAPPQRADGPRAATAKTRVAVGAGR